MTAVNPHGSLLLPPDRDDMIALAPDFGTRFMLFVDTEEEFDWDAPFNRASQAVTVLAGMARGQAYFRAAGVRPVYVTDYPVLECDAAADMIGGWVGARDADVGAHLHPWVNPPHVEEVTAASSYVGFQPEAVERAKLEMLCHRIAERFGARPVAYRAGRYGIGPNSARLLEEAGFRLDSSVRSRFDYSGQHGPDFRALPLHPYRAGPDRALVELPLSTAWVGLLRGFGDALYHSAQGFRPLPGGMARLGMLSRVPLTPEGVTAAEAIAAIDALLGEGVRVLNFSFHSPTLEPGHTPYVRDQADLVAFYCWWDHVLGHLSKRGVSPATLKQFLSAIPARAEPTTRTCQAA